MKVSASDPRWISLNIAHRHGVARTDSNQLAIVDLQNALADGRLPCMARSITDGSYKLIAATAWPDQLRLEFLSGGARVIHSKPKFQSKGQYIINPVEGWHFYVWQPALDSIWPPLTVSPAPTMPAAPLETADEPIGEPPGKKERAKAVLKTLYRTRAQMPRSLKATTKAVNDECDRRTWQQVSLHAVGRAAADLGLRPRKKIISCKRSVASSPIK